MPFQHHLHPTYSQFTQQYPQPNPIPPTIPQIQLPLPLSNAQNPPRPTQLPTQPIANLNNRAGKPFYNEGTQTLPTYVITTVSIQQVQLRSRKVLHQKNPSVVIEEEEEEEQRQQPQQGTPQQIPKENKNTTPPILLQEQQWDLKDQTQILRTLPYMERLALQNPVAPPQFDLEA